jgi:uncharacterized protein YecT (DUF1311 family)
MKRTSVLSFAGSIICLVSACLPVLSKQSQAEMNVQAQKDYAKADAELNRAYAKLVKTLDAKSKVRLKTAQVAWLKFRDAESNFHASRFAGGSIQPLEFSETRTELTEQRTKQLRDAYKEFLSSVNTRQTKPTAKSAPKHSRPPGKVYSHIHGDIER